MFQHTCKVLRSTIQPIVFATRLQSGEVQWGIGVGMFVNEEGWLITASHILTHLRSLEKAAGTTKARKRPRGNDVTHYTFFMGTEGCHDRNITAHVNMPLNIGVVQVEDMVPPTDYEFPKFRKQAVEQGELLCRAGYPFLENEFKPVWSAEEGFVFKGLIPAPMFVNEALVSRFIHMQNDAGSSIGTWIETSLPGLRGQSGGPLADVDGLICGIQVNTAHYPLDFQVKPHRQFLHVGRAVHCETVMNFLDRSNIAYFSA